jgi:hypothetical protein
MRPMSWYGGSQDSPTAEPAPRGKEAKAKVAEPVQRQLWRRLAWLTTTPLGEPVEPEEYWEGGEGRGSGTVSGTV